MGNTQITKDIDKPISEEEIDEIFEKSASQADKRGKDLIKDLKTRETEKIANEGEDQTMSIPGLGAHNLITREEADIMMQHIPGFVFQIHNALFKVTYVNDAKLKFTAECMNVKD